MADDFPKWGDPQLLPKPTIVRDSYERNRFDNAGVLKPNGPGPLPEGFLDAPDIAKLPWTMARGDEWTTPEFRAVVLQWLSKFLKARGISRWDIREVARPGKFATGRLPHYEQYLRIAVTAGTNEDLHRVEVSVPFPEDKRDTAPALAILALAAQTLDALLA